MSKYELSLNKDYVPDWTIVDAVRELFQNALDQQTTVEGNDMFFNYDEPTQTLEIGNKLSVLDPSTLLLGSSTKRDDDKTIGQFGEGYKVATLVLLREGKNITFYNYGRKEVWRPRFVKSRRYGTDILTFFTERYIWKSAPNNDLTILIEGITPEEYGRVVDSNLHLSKVSRFIDTNYGRILMEDKYKGRVFVNGLYVCEYAPYHYGYDFKPSEIQLDRDRKLVSDFNLRWLASKMWAEPVEGNTEMVEVAAQLIADNAADVAFVGDVYTYKSQVREIAQRAYLAFKNEYGVNAIPVTSNHEMDGLSPSYKPIIVSEQLKKVLTQSPEYKEPERIVEPPFVDKVAHWLDVHGYSPSVQAIDELRKLVEKERGY